MTRSEIAAELRKMSGGGLITLREVCRFVRDSNTYRVRKQYLSGLESCNGHYLVSDVAKRISEKKRREL